MLKARLDTAGARKPTVYCVQGGAANNSGVNSEALSTDILNEMDALEALAPGTPRAGKGGAGPFTVGSPTEVSSDNFGGSSDGSHGGALALSVRGCSGSGCGGSSGGLGRAVTAADAPGTWPQQQPRDAGRLARSSSTLPVPAPAAGEAANTDCPAAMDVYASPAGCSPPTLGHQVWFPALSRPAF